MITQFIRIVDKINDYVGKLVSWLIIVMMGLVVYEVFTRRVLGKPTVWTFETITMMYGGHFMFAAVYAFVQKSIASVDILYNKLSERKKAILDIFSYCIFFLPFVSGVFYYSISYAVDSWKMNERSWSVFAPPLYFSKTVIPVVFFLLLLQGCSELLKRILLLKEGRSCPTR